MEDELEADPDEGIEDLELEEDSGWE